jgi:eukaryotic-like serine/threonine-protein kinase
MSILDPECWRRMQPLLDEALALPPAERNGWLDRMCVGDPELRAMFERVMCADAELGGLLDTACNLFVESVRDDTGVEDVTDFGGTERFTVLRRLGAGGMGVVYEVHDEVRDDVVALKTLRRGQPADVLRLKREFRTLADIAHPNLVSLYELIADDTWWFFTMELVDGIDVVQYIRRHSAADTSPADRARGVLRQVVSGIAELHRRGKLHRDIKPSNILVTPAGRAVILDFGISSDVSAGQVTIADRLAGTPAYLAPERSVGGAPEPGHDWFGLGVTLYEALTARKPFGDSTLASNDDSDPALPSEIAPGVPADLDAICMGLLRRDPVQRFGARDVMDLLDGDAVPQVADSWSDSDSAGAFVGRRDQLAALEAALAAARRGEATAVYVHGPSGIGKSALLQCFLDRMIDREDVIALRGRCYEHESVPYKAFDGVIDSLGQFLSGMPRAQAEPLIPPDAAALLRLFSLTLQVEAIHSTERAEFDAIDAVELRQRGFAALRELLRRLAGQRPLILCVDDFQWADSDSAMLLRELLRPPQGPSALIVVCLRDEEIAAQPFLQRLLADTSSNAGITLPLGPLSDDEAQAVALSIIPAGVPVSERDIQDIVRESSGNPFLLGQLARHVAVHQSPHERTAAFTDVLAARLRAMSDAAQRFLQMLALCGRPMRPEIVHEACALDGDDRQLVAQLRSEHLLRSSGSAHRIELYHDRIREALVMLIGSEERRRLHHCMARALVARGAPEPEALYEHYREAGDRAEAAVQAAAAAQKAKYALAFDRAAAYYRAALELAPESEASAAWTEALGEALAHAGRPAEAGAMFLRAAADAPPFRLIELQRMAAEQLLIGGHIDSGLEVIRTVLRAVRMRLPAGSRLALASLIGHRAQLYWRGLAFVAREPQDVASQELLRLDTCWSVAAGLALVDMIRSADFHARHLRLALDSGVLDRITRAMALEAMIQSGAGGPRRRHVVEYLARAETIAAQSGQAYGHALCALARGVAALAVGDWPDAHEYCERALTMLRSQRVAATWERNCAQVFSLGALLYQGELRQVSGLLPSLLAMARDRGDLYFETELRTRMNLVWLAADRPEEGQREADEAMQRWSHAGFHRQHYNHALARIQTELYSGRAMVAWTVVSDNWAAIEKTQLLRMQLIRIEAWYLRARAALLMAAGGTDTDRFLAVARQSTRRLAREKMPWSEPIASLLTAAIAHVESRPNTAIEHLAAALQGFERADMKLYAAVARRCLGQLTSGFPAEQYRREAGAWMATQGIVNPSRMTQLIAPGFT